MSKKRYIIVNVILKVISNKGLVMNGLKYIMDDCTKSDDSLRYVLQGEM